jgi:hypothetical protein
MNPTGSPHPQPGLDQPWETGLLPSTPLHINTTSSATESHLSHFPPGSFRPAGDFVITQGPASHSSAICQKTYREGGRV